VYCASDSYNARCCGFEGIFTLARIRVFSRISRLQVGHFAGCFGVRVLLDISKSIYDCRILSWMPVAFGFAFLTV